MFPQMLKNQQDFSDQELFQGMLRNDRTVFEDMYRRFYPMARKQIIQWGGQEEDARDVFQEGVVAMWQNARSGRFQLQSGARLSTYLVRICQHHWYEKSKKASTRREIRTETIEDRGADPDFLIQWLDQEAQDAFEHQFGKLGTRCQELLRRYYYERESLRTIAEWLNVGEASAKNEKYRCMQRLKKIYQES